MKPSSVLSRIWRRTWTTAGVMLLCGSMALAPGASAQRLRPHEPLDPSKAQSLPTSPLAIQSGTGIHRFVVELADTQAERNIGLMHRNHLAPDKGMLFDFFTERPESFWMRNTFISLDIIFIRASGEIVNIAESTIPHSEKPVSSKQPVRGVLELAGGTAKRLGIKPGDVVQHAIFQNPPSP
jgi:uncharacterized membrane protein (UPF0127 family)